MARLSLDDAQTSSSSSSSKSKGTKGSKDKEGGLSLSSMDNAQKVKAGIAVVVILLAGVFILYNAGLLDGLFKRQASTTPDVTPEEVQAYEEAVRVQEQQMRRSGAPPVPVGAN